MCPCGGITSFGGPGDLSAPGGGFLCSNRSGLPLLLPPGKPPPGADKPPGPPKLAMKVICLGVICLVASLILFLLRENECECGG